MTEGLSRRQILVTRPQADQARTAAALLDLGFEAVAAPVMDAVALPFSLPDQTWQAVIITSRNSLRMLNDDQIERLKSCRIFCVGTKTAALAERLGFSIVADPAQDVADLIGSLENELRPEKGEILYLAGRHRSGALSEALSVHGLTVCLVETYEMVGRTSLSERAIDAIRNRSLGGILVYSTRTAALLVGLLEAQGLGDLVADVPFFCLSGSVAAVLQQSGYPVHVAESPNEAALLACVKKHHN
ncbi:uroporphyrinogen-III synthase [uncultured Cohaesibacter sp.]|uniref:uroporphyrinogen-III synthase n=1 Tax=uncultured Cohaesibacter sp. TaxID=1002546 RepID=UPI0029C7ADDA|nr:uroporphyrinogen-III synthase [uncultured Cohaesibacter sp.]